MSINRIGFDADQDYGFQVTVTVPATAQAGDLVVIYGATTRWPSLDAPGTFTKVHEELSGTFSSWEAKLALFVGVVGVDCDPGDAILIGAPGNNYGAVLACLRSSTGGTPLYAPAGGTGFASLGSPGDAAPTAPSITLPEAGELLFAAQVAQSSGGNTSTPPAGYTERADVNRAGIGLTLATLSAPAGASGAASSTASIAGAWAASRLHVYDPPATVYAPNAIRIRSAGAWVLGSVLVRGVDWLASPPPVLVAGAGSTSVSLDPASADYMPRSLDGTDGTILDGTAADVQAALDAAAGGETFRLRGGLYAPTSPFTCPADNVVIANYGDERVVFDGGNLSGTQDGVNGASLVLVSGRANQRWKGFIAQGAGPNRGVIHLLNSDAIKVEQVIVRDCLGEGVQVYGSDDCELLDVISIITALNNGARTGTNAPDCFSITANAGSYSHRTRVARCFGAYGQDDCLDNFRGIDTVILDSAMWRGGYHRDGSASVGDGGNFKTGGDPDSSARVRGCVAAGARYSNFFHNTSSPSALNAHEYAFLSAFDAGYVGIDAGSQAGSSIVNSIAHLSGRVTSGPLFYLGGSGTPATCFAGDPSWSDDAALDLSLAAGSPCLDAASDGDHRGASVEALGLLFKWANLDVMTL